VAREETKPILFKGDDFVHTEFVAAVKNWARGSSAPSYRPYKECGRDGGADHSVDDCPSTLAYVYPARIVRSILQVEVVCWPQRKQGRTEE
jgi:hypothetical protein